MQEFKAPWPQQSRQEFHHAAATPGKEPCEELQEKNKAMNSLPFQHLCSGPAPSPTISPLIMSRTTGR